LDFVWRNVPLLSRVLRLRLICGIVAAIATGLLVWRLGGQIGLAGEWRLSAVFLSLTSQIFYAATAHVANDWLSIPLFTALVACAIALDNLPTARSATLFTTILSAGLLTKAYFLTAVPFAAILLLVLFWSRRLPAPALPAACVPLLPAILWYARNYALYGDLSGVQQTVGGIPGRSLLAAASTMPWLESLRSTALTSLWFGNSSATRFSARTLYVLLVLLAAAIILYAVAAARRGWPRPERIAAAAMLCYAAGLVYSAVLHYVTTNGVMVFAAPWYSHPLYPPALCLLMLGLARSRRPGEIVRIAMLAGWTYLLLATYLLKLIPFYAGYQAPTIQIGSLLRWYRTASPSSILDTICLLPAPAIWAFTGAVVVAAIACAAAIATRREAPPAAKRPS
jgi:hypothetical protein